MHLESDFFKRTRPAFARLEEYGFRKFSGENRDGDRDSDHDGGATVDGGAVYVFSAPLLQGQFQAELTVTENGAIAGRVIDTDTDEEYTPIHLRNQIGGFVGTVREAYLALLEDIRQACFVPVSFASDQANRMEDLIGRRFGAAAEFPWEKYPGNGTFKCVANGKWFAAILTVAFGKLEVGHAKAGPGAAPSHDAQDIVEVLNLKADPDRIPELVCLPGVYHAWHMNKKHWISVILDDTLADDEILERIAESHRLVSSAKTKKAAASGAWMIPSNPKIYDVDAGFARGGGVIEWHQHNDIHVGDEVFIYSSAPNSAIMFRCEVIAANLEYRGMFRDKEKYTRSMRIRLLEKYPPDRYPLSFIRAHGGSVVRSARTMPAELRRAMHLK